MLVALRANTFVHNKLLCEYFIIFSGILIMCNCFFQHTLAHICFNANIVSRCSDEEYQIFTMNEIQEIQLMFLKVPLQ